MDGAEAVAIPQRLPMLGRDEIPPELAPLYDALLAQRGVVPNFFKTLANVPALAQGFAAFLKPLLGDGHLSGAYKELVATHAGWVQRCDYCVAAHGLSARQKGATEEQVAACLGGFEDGPFSDAEKLGFRLADRIVESGEAVDDAFFAQLKSVFTDSQILELIAVASAFAMFPRLVVGLRIPKTPPPAGS
jgi:uncharacterized peroxidase-related enzyme